MGWISFLFQVGLRIDKLEISEEKLVSIIKEERNNLNPCLSRLRLDLENTEGGEYSPNSRNETYDEENFGAPEEKEKAYIIYFNSLCIDESNGSHLDTNRAYCHGHIEFYHGEVRNSLMPSELERSFLGRISHRLGIEDKLSWTLRSKGSWTETLVKID